MRAGADMTIRHPMLAAAVLAMLAAPAAVLPVPGGDSAPAGQPVNPDRGSRNREETFEFAVKPTVKKENGKWVISFASKGKCDATVAILDREGRVIRHLASGVLGENAPWPFRQDSLSQRLEWDGKDDLGAPAPPGCVARVSLGLRVEFARMLCPAEDGVASRGPVGLATDREGNLYVLEGDLWVFPPGVAAVIQVLSVKAFDREGNYLRTLVPFRAELPAEQVSEIEFLTTADGRRIPLSGPSNHRPYCGFTRGAPQTTRHLPVITRGGELIFPCGSDSLSGHRRFIRIGTNGSARKDRYEGPPFHPGAVSSGNIFAALSPDEKYLYYAGARSKRGRGTAVCHAVYRVELEGKEPAAPFLGKESEPGTAEGQFNDPRGVDVDAEGRIFVGDYMNDRVQVFDPSGRFLKAMPVTGPEQIRVNRKTGAIYVLSVRDRGRKHTYTKDITWEVYEDKSVIRFASLEDWREAARLDLPKRTKHMHDAGPVMILDTSRDEPVLWLANVGRQGTDDFLWKAVDRGEKIERVPHKVRRLDRHAHIGPPLAADRRNNELYAFGSAAGHVRINPETGEVRKLELAGEEGKTALGIVGSAAVGPRGLLYVRTAKMLDKGERMWLIRRFDREGKLVPFERAGEFVETNGKQAGTPFNEQATPFAVGPDGRMYVVEAISRETRDVRMNLYAPDGGLEKAGFISMTRSGGCVRINVQGHLYAADTVRPKVREIPEFLPADPRGHFAKWYGTLFRYMPDGGGVVPADAGNCTHFSGGKQLPLTPATVRGTIWEFYGISPMPLRTGCQCLMADFDADDWGRVWVPDAPGYCVAVLDSAGNVITRFGAYGNRDATGAGGAVPVPPIPLWSPERVAVLDGDTFVVDGLNCRIVQVRIRSTVEEKLPLD
ncbi:MAG: hypothetical protein N3A38_05975 [Planctomycetota bacterium]|nr:hypothetical protein [Planctomycetota bacterium]